MKKFMIAVTLVGLLADMITIGLLVAKFI